MATRSALFSAELERPAARDDAPRTRPVAHFRVHDGPLDFRELCLRAVPTTTRVLVLDLDRTIHLGRNIGELLGWEICAHLGYGPSYLREQEATRGLGRVFLDFGRPRALLRYLGVGAQLWAQPGLFYFLWGKLAWHTDALRKRAFLRFGPEPIRAVQRVPQHALLHQIAALPGTVVRELAGRVLARHAPDQVVDAADVAWLRARCPGIKIAISSASPRAVVEAAGALLGVDAVLCSELEETDERACAPCDLSPGRPRGAPERISRATRQRINAGPAKLDALRARFPELADPRTESVGITDTGYGEDHSWTELFRTVIDVNSDAPFPPIVTAGSPTRAIHSAELRTRKERDAHAEGEQAPDPRRRGARAELTLSAAEIAARVGPVADEIEALARSIEHCAWELSTERAEAREALTALEPEIDAAVDAYNDAPLPARAVALAKLAGLLAERKRREARIVAIERPLSTRAYALTVALERARALVARAEPAPLGMPAAATAH
jgi:hypothetical protein